MARDHRRPVIGWIILALLVLAPAMSAAQAAADTPPPITRVPPPQLNPVNPWCGTDKC